jgi:acetolactate synthase-1/2/3 large subunit
VLPVLHQAISIALSGRKGPVLVDIPNDIQRAEISDAEVEKYVNAALLVDPVDQRVPSEREISELLSMCRASRRPLVCIGGGARWSSARNSWLRDLNYHGIPYVSTLMGCERVPAGPLYFGMIGAYGRRVANWAVQNCDLLLVLGARLDVRQTGADTSDFARCAKLVQVDIDSAQLNNRVPIDLAIWCSIDKFFDKFQVEHGIFLSAEQTWQALLQEKKLRYAVDEYQDWNVSPTTLFSALNRLLKDKPVEYVCDVGNHQMWAAQALELGTDQAAHYSGGMGAMGFALPTAIGIAVSGKSKVIVITGDGSLQVNIQEFDTVCRLGLDVGIIVLNNFSLGMVKNFQDMYFDGRDQSTRKGYSCPKFTEVARAYGLEAERVGDHESLSAALRRMTNATGPFLIEVIMEGATECRPRLAFGHKLDDQYPPL